MPYRWDDFSLDRESMQLTRQGQQVVVSRKVLDCIGHLIEQRNRVVEYDELIRKAWGHDNVTNNQLSQVIVAARRAVGDDAHAQRLIRTIPGIGYRWVGEVIEGVETPAAPLPGPANTLPPEAREEATSTLAQIVSVPPEPDRLADNLARHRLRRAAALMLGVVLAAISLTYFYPHGSDEKPSTRSAPATIPAHVPSPADPIAALRQALRRGRYEEVREGLISLAPMQADTPDARILEIDLDIERGRFDNAMRKLALQQRRAAATADPFWQARLYVTQSFLNGSAGKSGAEVLAPAQSAVALLESAGKDAAPLAMGEALSARGYGFMKVDQLEPATRDLIRARDLLLKAGDKHGAANAADTLARIQMRTGRFSEALELMIEIANFSQQADTPVQEIYARNAATKIQIEQLRWYKAVASSDRSMQLLQTVPNSERKARVIQLRALALAGVGRLREAASLIEEAEVIRDRRYSKIIPATFHLAAGHAEHALKAATQAEAFTGYDTNDTLNLESKEGALLLWMTAAQQIAANGKTAPAPSSAQLEILQKPQSSIGHIARGRWLWTQGKSQDAGAEFRLALAQSSAMGHLSTMLQASEPLIEMLLQRGDTAAAERAFSELRGYAPAQFDQDYRANLLGLRVTLAAGDNAAIMDAYRSTMALAGERTLPVDVVKAYAQRTQ